jgi:hypothetical protein
MIDITDRIKVFLAPKEVENPGQYETDTLKFKGAIEVLQKKDGKIPHVLFDIYTDDLVEKHNGVIYKQGEFINIGNKEGFKNYVEEEGPLYYEHSAWSFRSLLESKGVFVEELEGCKLLIFEKN